MIILGVLIGILIVCMIALIGAGYMFYKKYTQTISVLHAELQNMQTVLNEVKKQSDITKDHVDSVALQTSKQIARCEQMVNANTRAVTTINHGFQTYAQSEMMYM